MSTQNISTRVTTLSDSIKTTFQLINRLSKLTFQPGSTPLDGDGDVRVELAQDIQESLKQHDEWLELLRQELEEIPVTGGAHKRRDSERGSEKARLEAQVARLGDELRHARNQFRRAQLNAKRASEAAKQKERELLFASIQQGSTDNSGRSTPDLFAGRRQKENNKQLNQDEILVNASSDVTSALRRTHDLLSSELSRSQFAQETLDQSTAALNDLGERYSDLGTLLQNSRNLLGTLVRSQKSDTWYLETAFYILVVTICWLIFRRLIYGPAWWFIWLPLKYFILKPFYLIFAALGLTGKSASASSAGLSASATSVSTRPPLRVQPSARGGPPKFARPHDPNRPGVPVGGGGSGAKVARDGVPVDPSPEGSLSQKIGQMAEASRQEAQGKEAEQNVVAGEPVKRAEGEPVKRADGTVLQERGDKPRNPKKKMWEEDVESTKYESRKRDEL